MQHVQAYIQSWIRNNQAFPKPKGDNSAEPLLLCITTIALTENHERMIWVCLYFSGEDTPCLGCSATATESHHQGLEEAAARLVGRALHNPVQIQQKSEVNGTLFSRAAMSCGMSQTRHTCKNSIPIPEIMLVRQGHCGHPAMGDGCN